MEEYLSKRSQTNSYNESLDKIEDAFRYLEAHFYKKMVWSNPNHKYGKTATCKDIAEKHRLAALKSFQASYGACKSALIELNKYPANKE